MGTFIKFVRDLFFKDRESENENILDFKQLWCALTGSHMALHWLIPLVFQTFLTGLSTWLLNTISFSFCHRQPIPIHHSHWDSISMAVIKQGPLLHEMHTKSVDSLPVEEKCVCVCVWEKVCRFDRVRGTRWWMWEEDTVLLNVFSLISSSLVTTQLSTITHTNALTVTV